MRCESFRQFAIVQGDTAHELTEVLNAKLKELQHKRPEVSFEGLIARISYYEDIKTPETLADEYELAGAKLCCESCPMFSPIMKADGTEDARVKYGDCPFSEFGRTYKHSQPCEKLWSMINSGEVTLCLKHSED